MKLFILILFLIISFSCSNHTDSLKRQNDQLSEKNQFLKKLLNDRDNLLKGKDNSIKMFQKKNRELEEIIYELKNNLKGEKFLIKFINSFDSYRANFNNNDTINLSNTYNLLNNQIKKSQAIDSLIKSNYTDTSLYLYSFKDKKYTYIKSPKSLQKRIGAETISIFYFNNKPIKALHSYGGDSDDFAYCFSHYYGLQT